MKYLILIFFLTLCGGLSAQHISIDKVLIEKKQLPSKYLVREITAKQALKRNAEIHQILKEEGLTPQANEEYLYTAFIYHFENKTDSAQLFLQEGLRKVEHTNDTLSFKYLAQIAALYDRKYQLDSAQLYFKKGFNYLNQHPSIEKQMPNEVVSFNINFMDYLNRNGETKLWKDILDKTYEIAKALNKTDYLGFVENQLALYYKRQNDVENQERMYLLSISHTSKAFYRLARYLKLAQLYQDLAQWDKYEEVFPKIAKDLSRILEHSEDFNRLKLKHHFIYSKWLFHKNETKTAKKLLLSQLKLKNYLRTAIQSEAFFLLGENSIGAEQERFIKSAISSALIDRNSDNLTVKNVLFPEQLIKALRFKITTQKESINQAEIMAALNLINQIQKAFPFEEIKYAYQKEVRPFLSDLIAHSLDNPNNAFEYMEYGKAFVLNDVVSDLQIKFGNVDSNLLQEEKYVDQKLTQLRVKLANIDSAPDSLVHAVDKLRIKQSFLQKEMEQKSPNYYALKYDDNIPTIGKVQQNLKSNTAILSYFKQNEKLHAVLVKKNDKKVLEIPLKSNFIQTLNLFLREITTNPGLGMYKLHGTAQELYTLLMGDFEEDFKDITELIILRDAELNQLPFEILENPEGHLLLEKFAISYNYSAALMLNHGKTQKRSSLLAFAPYANGSFKKINARERNLGQLPFSTKEVDQISGTIYKNETATKNHFLQDYQKHGIIHFATHAQMDDKDPSRSFIAFYPDSTDYKLYTEELYNLSLQNTQLVILSACEAGGGKLQQGEGLMSLARGFTYAGCPSVITTLWKANDQSTAWLSERLHHYLKKGWNKAKALQQAKIDFRKSDIGQEFDHPYYWANFILIGNGEPLELSFWELYKWWFFGSILISVIVSLVLYSLKDSLKTTT